jgi:hypothetical protein
MCFKAIGILSTKVWNLAIWIAKNVLVDGKTTQ